MPSESMQHKMDQGRVRPPRVQITYDVETEGATVTVTGEEMLTAEAPATGEVEATAGVTGPVPAEKLKSSMARPQSAPLILRSVQRITSVWPGPQLIPVTVPETAARFAAALPSSAPAVAVAIGPVKSSVVAGVKEPETTEVPPMEYSNFSLSRLPELPPCRHCSPV